jgi:hypothetical protein
MYIRGFFVFDVTPASTRSLRTRNQSNDFT